MTMILLEHRCTSKREGVQTLLRFTLVAALLCGAVTAIYWYARGMDLCFYIAFCGICLLFVGLSGWVCAVNLRAGGEFVLRIDEQAIECRIPLAAAGQSFQLPIKDIVRVQRDSSGSVDSPDWYLHDKSGRRYKLTPN